MIENVSGKVIRQASLIPDLINGSKYHEVGYILKKEFWHQGFAIDVVKILTNYAFNTLNLNELIFEICHAYLSSRRVVEKMNAKYV